MAAFLCGVVIAPSSARAELQPVPPDYNAGGGSTGTGGLLVSLSPVAEDYVYRISTAAACTRKVGLALVMKGRFTPGAGGTFSASGPVRAPLLGRGRHVSGRYRLTGTIASPSNASGSLSASVRFRRFGKRYRCRIDGGAWSVRQPAMPAGSPLTTPLGGPLFGITSQSQQGVLEYSVVVHPWKPAGRIFLVWEAATHCTHGVKVFPFVEFTPS